MKFLLALLFTLSFGAIHAQDVDALLDRGYSKYLTEDYENALIDFIKARETDPKNAETHYLIGSCYSVSGKSKLAIESLSEAIRLDPSYAEAYYERGVIYLTDQNPQLAIKEFDEAIRVEPEFAEAYVSRGTARCMLEDVEGATLDWAMAKQLGVTYTEYMVCE